MTTPEEVELGSAGDVQKLVAGNGISLSPKSGRGVVTVTVAGSPTGPIEEITSTGGTVTVTDPNGPTTNIEVTNPTAGPATTVTGPDAFGGATHVGVGTHFAREDHDHGLPAITATDISAAAATTVTGPDAFGDATHVGVSDNYAREDHDHGLPAIPTVLPATQQGASYHFVLADAGTVVESTAAGAVNFTIDPHTVTNFPVGTIMEVFQYGAGQVTIVAGAGVTLRSDSNAVNTAAQYASIALRQRAQDEWVLSGDLA